MISKEVLNKGLYIDVESAGIFETFEELKKCLPKLADLWSKRCIWLRNNSGPELANATDSMMWDKKASLHPEFAKIVCISAGALNKDNIIQIVSYTGEEKDILNKVNNLFNASLSRNLKLAGHTIKNFDIPFIGKRMIINGIRPSEMINFFGKKPWETSAMDISEIFSFGSYGQNHISLDLMCAVFGENSPKDTMDGSEVHYQFYQGNIEKIKEYCEKDVNAVFEFFKKFSF